ncbi:MAG: hypothetical protein ABH824_06730 [Nanoarchaeota archaeon]|nr:hypothetical protein [Nanoarchaeota archaeon]MBU1631710.1 hypothetical protein [Nanoarchaeota archaeon]MBU1876228.1 hypothetical protein [Nanoarchaeota archaeon]
MKKIIIFCLFSITLFFLIGCVIEEVPEEKKEEIIICTSEWKCINFSFKAYQNENCNLTDETECTYGCVNGSCTAPTCTTGFKCKDNSTKAFQTENCSWINESDCELGCEDDECMPLPEVNESEEEIVEEVEEEEPEHDIIGQLSIGETEVRVVGGIEHNISLYFLLPDQAKFEVDGTRSDWKGIGDNFTIKSVEINITDILYQHYLGGMQKVIYNIK